MQYRALVPNQSTYCLQDEKLQLEKDKADLAMELQRANKAKEQAEAAARTAEKNAEQRLEDLLHQLDDAKHSTEAASTTSEFVRKVWVRHYVHRAGCGHTHYPVPQITALSVVW